MEIKKVGYSKVSIFLKTRKAANDLVSDFRLKERDLIAFISPSRISRKGIIRNTVGPCQWNDTWKHFEPN